MPAVAQHPAPLSFTPYLRPQIWGGRRLADLLGKDCPPATLIGESWEISAHPLHVSRVARGPWAGRTLEQLWKEHRDLWTRGGSAPAGFPLLVKWLDCSADLSVQVHPDDQAAQQLLNEPQGKTEAWVVLHAEPTARIYAGLQAGVDEAELRKALLQGAVEECLHSFRPQRGDVVFMPAGAVHAAGGGVLMAEVQQTSDATFRLYDWDRRGPDGAPRTLHIEQALECIDWSLGPVSPVRRLNLDRPGVPGVFSVLECPYFSFEVVVAGAQPTAIAVDSLAIVMCLSGPLHVSSGSALQPLETGGTLLAPPQPGSLEFRSRGNSSGVALVVRIP